jgi:formylmethanofuran dehydrogenase subunit D
VAKLKVTLVSGRTSQQGVGLEEGKTSDNYVKSVNHVQLCPEDAAKMKLKEDGAVSVETRHGSVVVYWRPSKELESGMAFFPYGPWANQVYGYETEGTGMPLFKGIEATMAPAKGKVKSIEELVKSLGGDEK